MPEQNGKGDKGPPVLPLTEVERVRPVEEQGKLPPTEAERKKVRLEKAAAESDEDRSKRHAKEMNNHLDAHMENIKTAHESYPAPLTRDFADWTETEQLAWNERSKVIASANKAYYNAVQRTFNDHQEEHRHVRRLHDEKVKNAQETV